MASEAVPGAVKGVCHPCLLLASALLAAGCGGGGPLARLAPSRSAHEVYAESLRRAGLDAAALGKAWLDAGAAALASPHAVKLPMRETGYLDPSKPSAVAYRFDLPRGRRLAVSVAFQSSEPAQVFLDLFRADGGAAERVVSAEAGATELQHVSRADGIYVLRLQPELLRGGRYTLTQRTEASLRFPVRDATERNVQSVFGDARDEGRREHHGVDIFAPRGTPVVAAAGGIVRSVNTTDIGGRVVWLYDTSQRQSLYYAHLDDWAVREGQQVNAGDVVGYVGNTGNAQTTAPHLHFGIYARGPVDPLPFIRASDQTPPDPMAPPALLGEWARVTRAPAPLRAGPDAASAPVATLPASTVMVVRAALSSVLRVWLPDGREGFVDARAVVAAAAPLRFLRLRESVPVRERPSAEGVVIQQLEPGTRVAVLGEFETFLLTTIADGTRGWLPRDAS